MRKTSMAHIASLVAADPQTQYHTLISRQQQPTKPFVDHVVAILTNDEDLAKKINSTIFLFKAIAGARHRC